MPYAYRRRPADLTTGDTGMVVDACKDCGHSLMDHWTPKDHPCTREDCLCPRWREDITFASEEQVFIAFPDETTP